MNRLFIQILMEYQTKHAARQAASGQKKIKRNRDKNFTEYECKVLLNIAKKYHSIIINKDVTGDAIKRKQQTWVRIANEFNQFPNVCKRLPRQLRVYWNKTRWECTKKRKTLSMLNKVKRESSVEQIINIADGQNNQQANTNNAPMGLETYEEFLTPIIASRMKQLNASTNQQKELQNMAIRREELQIKLLQDEIDKETEMHLKLLESEQNAHTRQLEKERETHELRVNQEKNLYQQRLRFEQELHQTKIGEYNKIQSGTYSMIYK